MLTTSARTGTCSPKMRTYFAPSCNARPRDAFRLVAHQQHGAARIGQPPREMVQDAPARGHAAGRDDDAGRNDVVDFLRFLHGARHVDFVHVQRIVIPFELFLGEFEVVVLGVVGV